MGLIMWVPVIELAALKEVDPPDELYLHCWVISASGSDRQTDRSSLSFPGECYAEGKMYFMYLTEKNSMKEYKMAT